MVIILSLFVNSIYAYYTYLQFLMALFFNNIYGDYIYLVIILLHYFSFYPSTLIDNVSSSSLSQGLISCLFNSALQYPGNDFSITSFSFKFYLFLLLIYLLFHFYLVHW